MKCLSFPRRDRSRNCTASTLAHAQPHGGAFRRSQSPNRHKREICEPAIRALLTEKIAQAPKKQKATPPPRSLGARPPIRRTSEEREKLRESGADGHVHGLVLAGGSPDEEENPLIKNTVVSALPIGARHRLVDVSIANLLKGGVQRMHVLTQLNSQELHRHITEHYPSVPISTAPHTLSFVSPLTCCQTPNRDTAHLGSADAVRSALEHVRDDARGTAQPDEIVIVSGQDLYNIDIQELLGFHRTEGADVTVVTQEFTTNGSEGMGLCALSPDRSRITQFAEKPTAMTMHELIEGGVHAVDVSLGVYVFQRSVLEAILEADMERPLHSLGADVIQEAVQDKLHVAAFEHTGRHTTCTSVGEYAKASLRMATGFDAPDEFDFVHELVRCTGATTLPPARVRDATQRNAVFAPGSTIEDDVAIDNAVIGPWSYVGTGAWLKNVVMHGARAPEGYRCSRAAYAALRADGGHAPGVGNSAIVHNAILAEGACIGENAVIINESKMHHGDLPEVGLVVRDGVTCALRTAKVPDGFRF